jgi:endonuclease/exonuclease/phosphatase family metal-dependent hydrolase
MKVLALNLCVSWKYTREARLSAVAHFCEEQGVDVLLVQEGVRSCFVYDTLRFLAKRLGFHQFCKSNIGFPLFWEFRVGVLSRYPILSAASLNLKIAQNGGLLDRFPLPWRKRAVSVTVDVPGLGIANLISVHLSSCAKTIADKARELALVSEWRQTLSPCDVEVFGGDFNTSLDGMKAGTSFGASPDYVFVQGGQIINPLKVFPGQTVTDHDCGLLVEVAK